MISFEGTPLKPKSGRRNVSSGTVPGLSPATCEIPPVTAAPGPTLRWWRSPSPPSSPTSATRSADPCLEEAKRLEQGGHRILKLNIGNPAPFGFEAPRRDPRRTSSATCPRPRLQRLEGPALRAHGRRAVLPAAQGIGDVDVEDDLPRQRRLRADRDGAAGAAQRRRRGARPGPGLPAVDRRGDPRRRHAPCTTSATRAPTGCRTSPTSSRKITDRTKALVIINPNNPTGAVYRRELLEELARARPPAQPAAVLRRDLRPDPLRRRRAHPDRARRARPALTLTFNGLSKAYRVAGFRSGWMVVSGPQAARRSLHRGPDDPGQHAAVRERARRSTRSRPRSAATRASTTWSCPAGGCSSSATSPTSCSTRSRASRASSRRARCTASRASTRRSTRSRTTSGSCLDLLRSEKILVVQGTRLQLARARTTSGS